MRYEEDPDSTREPGGTVVMDGAPKPPRAESTVLMEGAAPIAAIIARSLDAQRAQLAPPGNAVDSSDATRIAPVQPIPQALAPVEGPPLLQSLQSLEPAREDRAPARARRRAGETIAYVAGFLVLLVTTVAITFYFLG